jgi:hypothetical protein
MRYYAGIDVGVRNLCWCIIDIDKWKNYNIDSSINTDPGIVVWKNIALIETYTCEGVFESGKKKGEICGSPATFTSVGENNIKHYWCGKHKPENCKQYRQKTVKSQPVGDLIKLAFQALDKEPLFSQTESIVIELQLKKNPTMKRMSNALEAYFIVRYKMCENPVLKTLKYSSAKNKLKVFKGAYTQSTKKGYAAIKDVAKIHTETMLKNCEVLDRCYTPFKKKDDLADAFLHCVGSI